jgi:hypothetical protein|eukprot:SAG11_NODE_549_length_8592_cov_11.089721_2_plen_47_part_00
MNQRGQVDLIDMQSLEDPTFRWLLNYQDHAIKVRLNIILYLDYLVP